MKIVCIGDSLTYGYGVSQKQSWVERIKQKSGVDVFNKGINGNTTKQISSRLTKDLLSYKPTYSVIMGGINDLLQGNRAETVIENIQSITTAIQKQEIQPILILTLPVNQHVKEKSLYLEADFSAVNKEVKKVRKALSEYAVQHGVAFIDLFESFMGQEEKYYLKDGIHITAAAHELIAKEVMNKLELTNLNNHL